MSSNLQVRVDGDFTRMAKDIIRKYRDCIDPTEIMWIVVSDDDDVSIQYQVLSLPVPSYDPKAKFVILCDHGEFAGGFASTDSTTAENWEICLTAMLEAATN